MYLVYIFLFFASMCMFLRYYHNESFDFFVFVTEDTVGLMVFIFCFISLIRNILYLKFTPISLKLQYFIRFVPTNCSSVINMHIIDLFIQ